MENNNIIFKTGGTFLYITPDGKYYKLPHPKGPTFKAIPILANQDVLMVTIIYNTLNRHPVNIIHIDFNRVLLDYEGKYVIDDEELYKKLRNTRIFGSGAFKTMTFNDGVIEIPDSPSLPTSTERNGIVSFLKDKYPRLYKTSLYAIEEKIKLIKHNHQELLADIKRASKRMDEFSLPPDENDTGCPF
jgi:hypothetical protein